MTKEAEKQAEAKAAEQETCQTGEDSNPDDGRRLEEALAAEIQLREELENRLLRLQADFDNFRRRTQREREDIYLTAEAGVIKSLLPVLDNFQRALDSLDESESEGWAAGIKLVHRQLNDILASQGMEAIQALGQQFDPNLHEAIMREENEEAEDGTILAELQKGYLYKDKLLRPSMVKVAFRS